MQTLQAPAFKLSLGNSKTGPAFSISNGITCPGKTATCAALCYVDTGRMALHKDSRMKNLKGVLSALSDGSFVKQMTAHIVVNKLKTLRIHDSGDFFSPTYVRAWEETIKANPNVTFWAYTRSFNLPDITTALVSLAKLENVAIWLSADVDNWLKALAVYKAYPGVFAGIAFMETKGEGQELSEQLTSILPAKNLVIFPVHGSFGRLSHEPGKTVPNCPAITKEIPHDAKSPACLRCMKCLPGDQGENP